MKIHHKARQKLRIHHIKLCTRSSHYATWHNHPHHKKVHYGVLVIYLIAIGLIFSNQIREILQKPVFAASQTYIVDENTDWGQGNLTNIDYNTKTSNIELTPSGNWDAKIWKNPPDPILAGMNVTTDGTDLYVLRGGGLVDFWKYSPVKNEWTVLANAPRSAYFGATLQYGPSDTIYAIFGQYTKKFYKYTISTNTWTELAETFGTTGPGSSLAWDGTNLYVLRGNNTQDFWIYNETDGWNTLPATLATINNVSSLVYDGSRYFYTWRGNNTATVYRYDKNGNGLWQAMTTNFPLAVNEMTTMTYYNGELFALRPNSTIFYKCTISDLTCSGGAWTTLATLPATVRYTGLIRNPADGYIYIFRGNNNFDFWKYHIGDNKFIGPEFYPQSITTGGDLIWDGADTVYGLKGGAAASGFYAYSISGNTWTLKSVTGLPALSYDTKAVKAGNFIYAFQGNSTNFYAYDTTDDASGWVTKHIAPGAISNGGSLAYPGTGNYVYALRGNGTTNFYAYDISDDANGWTNFDPTDLPIAVNIGGRLISDGTYIYALAGNGTPYFYRYTYAAGGGTWDEMPSAPFIGYYGTDLTYYNGKIYATAGFYKDAVYEYNISAQTWKKISKIQTRNISASYAEVGLYAGASLEYFNYGASHILMATRGNTNNEILTYSISTQIYNTTGVYESPVIDLTYVDSWNSLTVSADTTPGENSVSTRTRTSVNGSSWSSYVAVNGTTIESPDEIRYLQVEVTLASLNTYTTTPKVYSYTVDYNTEESPPGDVSNVKCYSQEVDGVQLTSGQTYRYTHPYCNWDPATDAESGIDGYYVYFGPNQSANPVSDGVFQTQSNFIVNKEMSNQDYYLLIKSKDLAGNPSTNSVNGFNYDYVGATSATPITKTSTADFGAGDLSNIDNAEDDLTLTGQSSFWQQFKMPQLNFTVGYGASIVYKSSVNKLYIARGNNQTTFWEYDIATNTLNTLNSTGLLSLYYGGGIVNGPGNYIYAIRGGLFDTFYRYDITDDASGWSDVDAEDAPLEFGYGGSLVYDGSRYIYAARGNSANNFYRFDPLTTSDGQWTTLEYFDFGPLTPNNNIYNGGGIIFDGNNTIYAVQGNQYTEGFAKYTISGEGANTWTPLGSLPNAPGAGSAFEWDPTNNQLIYAPGGGSNKLYTYNPVTEVWAELTQSPLVINNGGFIKRVEGDYYILQGNTAVMWKYNLAKNTWYLPNLNIFGLNYKGASLYGQSYGSSIVHTSNNNFYLIRGNYDNQFVRYNATSGVATKMADMPVGTYSGASMVYVSGENAIYMMPGIINKLFKYSIATNSWSEITTDVPPIQSGYGSSMVFDGSRYIYYARGANTTSWYRYDLIAGAGSRWSIALPTTNFGGQGYGAQMLIKDGYIYTLRGQNVNPNPFYRFNLSQLGESPPYTGSWEVLTSISTPIYNDGFLIDGNNGKFYAARATNTAEWWEYDLTGGEWTRLTDFPGQIYQGGAGRSNGSYLSLILPGTGSNTYTDGVYSHIAQSSTSSFVGSGVYTSESIDLTSIYDWGNIKIDFNEPSNTTLVLETSSSSDNSNWSSWAIASQEKQLDSDTYEYSINSPVNRYIKVKISLESGDNVLSPSVAEYTINYYQDTTAPNNPTALSQAKSASTDGSDITSNNWYNFANPYFVLPEEDAPGGATDGTGGSGVDGYYVYFGTSPEGIPNQNRGLANQAGEADLHYQTDLDFEVGVDSSAITTGQTYYLRMQTKDNAGNTKGEIWTAFIYKLDTTSPVNPTQLTVNPIGYTNIDEYTFTISQNATDVDSGLKKYQYRTGNDLDESENEIWYDFDPLISYEITIPNPAHTEGQYSEDGINQFYVRVVDNANNTSTPKNIQYYFGSNAPSPPTNLQANPTTYEYNSFTFTWDTPVAYIGDPAKITYYYSVNANPTPYNTNSTTAKAVGPSAFATQWGANEFFVVAKDEAGNINYNNFAKITFTAETSAPSSPTQVNVSDISNKETDEYRLVISWNASTVEDPNNFNGYDIYESEEEAGPFTKIANTSGTAHVHTNLDKDSTHYYYVKATDKTGNSSAPSSTVDQIATGKYTTPPTIVKEPEASPRARKATITWITNREATSSVEFGTDPNNLNLTDGNAATVFETDHHVDVVKNVQPDTVYYYRVVFVDPDGNVGQSSPIRSFRTSADPAISTLKTEDITLNSILITWDSNVPSYGKIAYGSSINRLDQEEVEPQFYTTHHVVKLRNLTHSTTYFFQVQAYDEDGNYFTSDIYNKDTLPLPIISSVKAENQTEVNVPTVNISFKSNVKTSPIVRYNSAGGSTKEYVASDYKTEHTLKLENLLPAQPYTFTITGRDEYGNEAKPENIVLQTLADSMPPKVTKLIDRKRVIGQGESAEAQLTVKVVTDEQTKARVEVSKGIGNSDFNITANDDTLNTEHTIVVKLGDPGSSYSYRVKLYDGAENLTETEVKTFVIQNANKSAIEYISSIFARSFSWLGVILSL